jgi:glucose-1-phosphate thymidylyltransferase
MKIIVPMAGIGKRMRPHTLTVPKPLVVVAGKPIVQHLVEDITKVCGEPVTEIAYIIGAGEMFGTNVQKHLIQVAENLGANASIYTQTEALGTAHAVLCAKDSLDGKVVVAFADTLFKADFTLDAQKDGIIWVNKIEDPRAFGVVKLNDDGFITDFHEKPETFISDLAIIGIYYFKNGENLRNELQYLIDNNIKEKGEYQLTNALENMKNKGLKFATGSVTEWLDCGNKNATVYTNQRMLEILQQRGTNTIAADLRTHNAHIIPPCYIASGVTINNAVVGPHVSIGAGTLIENAIIKNTIIQNHAHIANTIMHNSMVGSHAIITGTPLDASIGDHTEMG